VTRRSTSAEIRETPPGRGPTAGWVARRPAVRRISPWAALLLCAATILGRSQAAEPDSTPFRIGFSRRLFTEVNINDAKASVKAWAQTVARERDIPTDPDPAVLDGVAAMEESLRGGKLDALALTLDEYGRLLPNTRFDPVFVSLQNGRTNVEYLVLAHQDSGIQALGDLRGRSLACYQNPRTSLALPWLDTHLVRQGLSSTTGWVGRVTHSRKVSGAVLPVFFRQMDACLVDRGSFETMSELNPQVGKRLKAIAASPPLVPMLFCLRSDYSPRLKARIVPALQDLHKTTAGQQVLTAFQMERLLSSPLSSLDSALELLAMHQRLCGGTNSAQVAAAKAPSDEAKEAEK
jgi:ABC-type phosphate/phosphonate transport system substrate-binding protein